MSKLLVLGAAAGSLVLGSYAIASPVAQPSAAAQQTADGVVDAVEQSSTSKKKKKKSSTGGSGGRGSGSDHRGS